MDFQIPSRILRVMETLEAAGFEAWAVGGCVRDRLLGKEPHDWDLTTNALPEQTAAVFAACQQYHAGIKHGTVAIVVEGESVEITTFRSEGGYADHRHPDWIRFETDITRDLARRDFTINAMAYRPGFGLADPFGGRQDLREKRLRAVGEPELRFREDGLRILRGVRFAARFSLIPEQDTLSAMVALAPTLRNQAKERVFAELSGWLPFATAENMLAFSPVLREAIPALAPLMGFEQHNYHHKFDVFTHTALVVEGTPRDQVVRWAALLHDVAKPQCFRLDESGVGHFKGHASLGSRIAGEILEDLRAPNALRDQVMELIACHGATRDFGILGIEKPVRRLLRRLGEEGTRQLLALDRADDRGKGTPHEPDPFDAFEIMVNRILSEQPCLTLHDLQLNGKDLMDLGISPGKEMGEILNRLLDLTADGELENEKTQLRLQAELLAKEMGLL